jgi:tellurite resistance protein TehA-like permease
VTGTTGLAVHTGAGLFRWAAAGLCLVLVAAWAVVSVRTVTGIWRGQPAPGGAARSGERPRG